MAQHIFRSSDSGPGFFRHASSHRWDWLLVVFLMFFVAGLQFVPPFQRYVDKGGLEDLRYPLKHNTIPVLAVPIIAVLIPLLVIFLVVRFGQKDSEDLHHAVLGLFATIMLTALITDTVKLYVGRLRPDFYWRCFPPGTEERFKPDGNVWCTGDASVIKEGRKSFPSGHSSWTSAGLSYLTLYLAGQLHVFNGDGNIWKLIPVLTPMLVTVLMCISRVSDYWHHWQDVTVGGLLGFVIALAVYHQHYPPLTYGGGYTGINDGVSPEREHNDEDVEAGADRNVTVSYPSPAAVDAVAVSWNGGSPYPASPRSAASVVSVEDSAWQNKLSVNKVEEYSDSEKGRKVEKTDEASPLSRMGSALGRVTSTLSRVGSSVARANSLVELKVVGKGDRDETREHLIRVVG